VSIIYFLFFFIKSCCSPQRHRESENLSIGILVSIFSLVFFILSSPVSLRLCGFYLFSDASAFSACSAVNFEDIVIPLIGFSFSKREEFICEH